MKSNGGIILFTLLFICDVQPINLSGRWNGYILYPNITFHQLNESATFSFNATVPGGVYTDLAKAGIIPENLHGDNDVRNRWVGNQIFAFTTSFQVNETFLQAESVILTFHGLDTFAMVYVNNIHIGNTSNMFVRYQYNVKEHLAVGQNELKVILSSPVKKAIEVYKEQSQRYVVPPECVPNTYNGECHVNHIRKMQASFSWDWGPAFPSVGIWKNVELSANSKVLVADVTVNTIQKNKRIWDIEITVFLDTASDAIVETIICNIRGGLTIYGVDLPFSKNVTLNMMGKTANASVVALSLPATYIMQWWPNGYGRQILYPLKVEVTTFNHVTLRNFQLGFRTVELIQEPLAQGLSFYFKINGVAIFAKGSNWIPASVFPELSADEATVRHLLKSAKDANMNMLRVWGGGFYESDLFYKIADEYGIMIWQDFMFACSMYPTTPDFLESVREEIKQNVKRLQHHPSIVLWAGNNENEVALYGNWYGTGNKTIYKEDYIKLYVDIVKTEVEKIDSSRPYVVSSPSDGLFTERNNYLGPDPYSNLYGDVHYYNYVNNGWDINHYPRTRFASEYGVQSIPSIHTLATATNDIHDLEANSEFMKHRQHLLAGYESMETLVSKNFDIPHTDNMTNDLINYIYLTQVNQAVSIKIQTESYRQARSSLNSKGEGMTMGALYWQLNDVWQAPSWSSIEFGGRWKMLHYYALDFFAPVIISPHVSAADDLELYIVSDRQTEIKNCKVTVNTYKWNSLTPIRSQVIENITIPSNSAKLVANFWLDDYLHQAGCGSPILVKRKCVIEFVLTDESATRIAPDNYVYPESLKKVTLPSANVTVQVHVNATTGTIDNDLDYIIELQSNRIALFVWLEVDGRVKGRFSENGFHMFHGVKNVLFHTDQAVTVDVVVKSLSVTSLSDVYNRGKNMPHFVFA